MRVGLDVSGGDFAPTANLDGVALAMQILTESTFYLFGNQEEILKHKSYDKLDKERVVLVNAPQTISYHDHPARAVLKKPKSSISVGLNWLSTRKIDVFSSTGNTVSYTHLTLPTILLV